VYLEGPFIRLSPTPTAGGSIEAWYYQRPNQLVATSKCAKITNVSSAGGTTTFTVDTNIQSEVVTGGLIDIVSGRSPFVGWAKDVVTTLVGASTIEVATADVVDEASTVLPQIGDYISAAKTSNIPQMPQEFHPVLAQAVACRILSALGDQNKLQDAQQTRERMMQGCLALIANRIESSIRVINNKFGFVNGGR
jgi:hypothetical protein